MSGRLCFREGRGVPQTDSRSTRGSRRGVDQENRSRYGTVTRASVEQCHAADRWPRRVHNSIVAATTRRQVIGDRGDGSEVWVVDAQDAAALGDSLACLIAAADRAGLAPFDALLRGSPEACRYAIEVTGIAGASGASPPRRVSRPQEVEVAARRLAPEQAVSLMEAWTKGLEVELSPSRRPEDLTLRRSEPAKAHVRVRADDDGASELLASLPVSMGTEQRVSEPVHQPPIWRRRRGVALAAMLAVMLASTLVATSSSRRATQSSTAASPTPSPPAPTLDTVPPASGSAISADPATGGFLLVGCCDAPSPGTPMPASTWEWDGSVWNHLHPTTPPPYARNMVLGFDGVNDSFVLHSGDIPPATWVLDRGARTWRFESDAVQPPSGPASVADGPSTAQPPFEPLVVTGGQLSNDLQTWSRIGDGWRFEGAVGVPASALFGESPLAMANDEARGNVVLLLESGAGSDAPTYLYDGRTWTVAPAAGPPFDPNTQLAWDRTGQRVLAILPGASANPVSGVVTTETWAWDGAAWAQVAAPGGPGGRGRLLTSSLGVVLFMSDGSTGGRPNITVWNGTSWTAAASGGAVVLHQQAPSINDLLGRHQLVLSRGLPQSTDQGTAVEVAVQSVPQPAGNEYLRVASVDTGSVTDTDTGKTVCLCWVLEVLRTALPTCPGLELVEREAIVLVDVQTNRLMKVIDDPAPAGVTFGSCVG